MSKSTALRIGLAAAIGVSASSGVSAHAASKPKPKPKPIPACVTWTDPAGDASPQAPLVGNPAGQPADSTLDITQVTLRSDGTKLTADIAVPAYAARPTYAYGNRYQIAFSIGDKAVIVYYNDSATRANESSAFYQAGITVGGTQAPGSDSQVTETVVANVVSLSVSLKDLAAAVAVPVLPTTPLTSMAAAARGTYIGLLLTNDTAPAPDALKITPAACNVVFHGLPKTG